MVVDINIAAQDDAGYCGGIFIGTDASFNYHVIFDPGNDLLGLYQLTPGAVGGGSVLSDTGGAFSVDLATDHILKAIVTATNIQIDWWDGSAWQTNALSRAGAYVPSSCGLLGFSTAGRNDFSGDDHRIRTYATPEPTYAIGSEEDI